MTELDATITSVVDAACRELFAHYEIPVVPSQDGDVEDVNLAFCGVIGFSGSDLRGAVMMASSSDILVTPDVAPAGLRDWIAELTNQLLGRVKNKLISLGAVIHISTPVVLRGERLAPMSSQRPAHLFRGRGGVVAVWFDAECRPDLVLAASPMAGATAAEGDTLMF